MLRLQPDKEMGARVVVLFVGTEYIPFILQHTADRMQSFAPGFKYGNHEQKQIIWLASEAWDRNNDAYTQGYRKLVAKSAIVLMLESQRVPSFEKVYFNFFFKLNYKT